MRLGLNPRADRRLARLPRPTAFTLVELALLALIAVQAARLAWTLVTPVGPVGDWKASSAFALPAGAAALGEFDPFFRLSAQAGPTVVTGLNLKLYGVREDRATGRGSAIIALPDGTQSSFAVGEELIPGVTLAAVGFDSVTVNRGGAMEQIFLDQSAPAAPPAGAAPAPATAAASPPAQVAPPIVAGPAEGIAASALGDAQALRAAGLAPGDAIVSVNGQRVTSIDQLRALAGSGEANVVVNRGGREVPIRVRLNL